MNEGLRKILRNLPSIDELLNHSNSVSELVDLSKSIVTDAARSVIQQTRMEILEGKITEININKIIDEIIEKAKTVDNGNLRKVINGTGVVLHTNLGRALLSEKAKSSVLAVAGNYSNLELNLETGARGSRYSHVEDLLIRLTGAEAALVVNNNAGAVLLALTSLAHQKEVIVSRGQLVEIGGAFRVPDVMLQSGATLVEVGTTNKTYQRDYEAAITENTALILKVHTSNYRVVGFTHETSLQELVALGSNKGIPVMEDVGSGFLISLKTYGITDEPTVQECVKAGAEVVTFSGDKLLGGPQAGIIVGKKEYIDRMKQHPLTRALRIDKLTISALEATLLQYLDPESVIKKNPTLRMLTYSMEELRIKASALREALERKLQGKAYLKLAEDYSQVGGGALPTTDLPTVVLKIRGKISPAHWAEKLRQGNPAVMVRVKDNQIIIDPRTILDDEISELAEAFASSVI